MSGVCGVCRRADPAAQLRDDPESENVEYEVKNMRWWKWLKQLFWEKEENVLFYMQGHDVLPQPLSREEEEVALIAWENGDEEARSRLIEHNLRLVVYIAKRYETNPIFMEDLISIGSIGLIKAVNTFRRDKNIKLVTYASRCIENEILMFLRKKSRRKVEVSFDEAEKAMDIDLKGDDMGVLIGKRGQTLDSLQYLVSLVVNRDSDDYIRVKVDTENYRKRRKETLENLAKNIAYKVKRTKRSVSLEPMNPYERRIIHSALQNDKFVTTHSEGDEPFRHVVVTLKK